MNKLFVYGILVNMFEDQIPATLEGFRKEIHGHATIIEDDTSSVEGQLIEVDDDTFRRIDRIESYPSYYTRFKVNVKTKDGIENVWVYQMNLKNGKH